MAQGCVIFDFDGVIADTEGLHLQAYNEALSRNRELVGGELHIPAALYFQRYIVYGNQEGFWHMLRDAGRSYEPAAIEELCRCKDQLMHAQLHQFAEPLPGVRDLLAFLQSHRIFCGICSGAQKREIIPLLQAFGLQEHFKTLITIEDVRRGKPDPQGYAMAFDALNRLADGELSREQSVVIEDSAGGAAAGKAAGLQVLGVATSLDLAALQRHVDWALPNLSHLHYPDLAARLGLAL